MVIDIDKLEEVLNKEIETYSKLEKFVLDKKQSLISGDLEKLKVVDFELEKYSIMAQKLEGDRNKVTSILKNNNLTLKDVIEKVKEKEKSTRLLNLRKKLNSIVENINLQNNINAKLIEHSLKMVECSVLAIAKALVPENSSYNSSGKIDKIKNIGEISSVSHEA